jgi:hypothetical protein
MFLIAVDENGLVGLKRRKDKRLAEQDGILFWLSESAQTNQ